MALIVTTQADASLVGVWSVTAVLLGVLIVYATTQPQKVRTVLGALMVALGAAGVAVWVDQVFYCPDCCGPIWFLCWWM